MRSFPSIAPPPSNIELNPPRGFFSVVVPEATTNLIINPSVQLATTGYTNITSAVLSRDTTRQRRGPYSLKVTPSVANDGVGRLLTTVVGQTYTFSIDLFGAAGRRYDLEFAGDKTVVYATGRWQRIWVTSVAVATSTSLRIRSAKALPFWTDGWQVEAKPYPTTYCDGSMRGFFPDRADYAWTGLPYASTSVRSAKTKTGGRVMRLDSLGFKLLAVLGLSATLVSHAMIPLSNGGSSYQKTQFPAEQPFSLAGIIEDRHQDGVDRQVSQLQTALSAYNVPETEPLKLLYQPFDDEQPIGDEAEITALWDPDGGELSSVNQQRVNLAFRLFVPSIVTGTAGAELLEQSTIASAENVLYRSPTGQWQRLGISASATPGSTLALAPRAAGGIYAGGQGLYNSAINHLAQWDGTAWATVGVAAPNGFVQALAVDAQGRLYAGGGFTNIGGVAANQIARFDPATNLWTALGSGTNGPVRAIAIAPNGDIYVGGSFTTAGGVAAANIAKYVPSTNTWSALGAGTNNPVLAIIVNAEGQVFVGGQFTTAGGVANTTYAARWNPTGSGNWAALATGIGGGAGPEVDGFTIGPDSRLYVFGQFTTAGGVTVSNAAIFNGTSFEPLGVGFTGTLGGAWAGDFTAQGILYIGGRFTALGDGTPVVDSLARWTGGAIVPADLDIAVGTTTKYNAVLAMPDGGLYVGFDAPSAPPKTAIASGITTVTNGGPCRTYPIIELTATNASGTKLYSVANETTGKGIFFTNYTMQNGEKITMILRPDALSIESSFQGNIIGQVAPGSQHSEMYLLPGQNVISLFMERNDVTATIQWPICNNSLHDAAWR